MKLLVYSLGLKGLRVIQSLVESSLIQPQDLFCVIGQDACVVNDYSDALIHFCRDNSIRFSLRQDANVDQLTFDLALAISWRWMIDAVPSHKLVVFHDSLLPKYRGFAPLVSALLNKEKFIGVSAIFAAKEYDKGDIILQKKIGVEYPTSIELEIERITELYVEMASSVVLMYIKESSLSSRPQDESQASYSLWRDQEDYKINWNAHAVDIEHFIRCVGFPYLGASTYLNGELVRIFKAVSVDDVVIENRSPGKVVFMENEYPIVVCGQGLLRVEVGNYENKKLLLPLSRFRSRFV